MLKLNATGYVCCYKTNGVKKEKKTPDPETDYALQEAQSY